MENKWMYNTSDDIWMGCEKFDTKEEAIQAGKEEYKDHSYCKVFFVGQMESVNYAIGVNVDNIIEDIHQSVYDEVGEVAEDYLNHIKGEHLSELESEVDKVVLNWLDKFDYKPDFFKVVNIESVAID